jgi:hypothetical protein
MPRAYEAMRDKFAGQGLSSGAAKSKAAAIYNSKNPNNPVTRAHSNPGSPSAPSVPTPPLTRGTAAGVSTQNRQTLGGQSQPYPPARVEPTHSGYSED